MNNASDIVISGCSGGGLSTWLHADWIKDNLLNGVVYQMIVIYLHYQIAEFFLILME